MCSKGYLTVNHYKCGSTPYTLFLNSLFNFAESHIRENSQIHQSPSKIRSLRIFRQMSRLRNSAQLQLSKKESLGDNGGALNTTRSSRQKQGKYGFTRKCGRLVKEQRARFYIMRRCVVMLICWTDHNNNNSDHS